MIKAEIVADSLSPQGERLTSLLITFPRIILAEVNTHRMLSKNTASSRAIPFKKMVEAVQENPFIPIAWQKEHKGMQGSEYLTGTLNEYNWLKARDKAVEQAKILHGLDVTKQLCNRLLEPFMWTTMLITGSKESWDNFFELRCPSYSWQGKGDFKSWKELVKSHFDDGASRDWIEELENTSVLERLQNNKGQAEIHMMALAEAIYDAMNESTPKQLKAGEWHIPFEKDMNQQLLNALSFKRDGQQEESEYQGSKVKVKISTAMAARTSYTIIGDEKEIDYEKMIKLHDRLINQNPPHSSPTEHCARAMSDEEFISYFRGELPKENLELTYSGRHGWCRNYNGFIQYRHIIESKNNN